jgi:hypothetical protein
VEQHGIDISRPHKYEDSAAFINCLRILYLVSDGRDALSVSLRSIAYTLAVEVILSQ